MEDNEIKRASREAIQYFLVQREGPETSGWVKHHILAIKCGEESRGCVVWPTVPIISPYVVRTENSEEGLVAELGNGHK